MPWHIVQNHSQCSDSEPWAVVKDSDGSVAGCHGSEASAKDQLAALYASEEASLALVGARLFTGPDGQPAISLPLSYVAGQLNYSITPNQQINLSGGYGAPSVTVPTDKEKKEREEARTRPGAWEGVLVVEGTETGDGRVFAEGSLSWPELPIPLSWQPEALPRHEKSVVVGRIEHVERRGNEIWGEGLLDLESEHGREIARQMGYDEETGEVNFENVFAGGVSVDVDSVKDADVELVFPQGGEGVVAGDGDGDGDGVDDDDDLLVSLFGPPPDHVVFHKGRLRGATLVALPAFVEARLHLVASTDRDSLIASAVPVAPPHAWFQDPRFDKPTTLQVTDDGLVRGHLALWGTCHTTFQDRCITPPREEDYAYFARGELKTAEGDLVGVGQITLGTGHAPGGRVAPAVAHYDNTGWAVADVNCGADRHGVWVSGALRSGVTERQVRELRAAALSGDWRRIGGRLRLVAVLAVNVPGYPIPRMRARFDSDDLVSLVAAGVATEETIDKIEQAKAGDGYGTIRVRKVS